MTSPIPEVNDSCWEVDGMTERGEKQREPKRKRIPVQDARRPKKRPPKKGPKKPK